MKHVQAFAAAILALIIVGCGGANNSSGSTTIPSDLSTPRIEAIVRVERSNLKTFNSTDPNSSLYLTDDQLADPLSQQTKTRPDGVTVHIPYGDLINTTVYGFQDPLNFQTGEEYIFQLAAYHSNGTRVVFPATFQSLDLSGTYGNLGTNSGAFQASNNTTTSPQTIIATYNGVTYQTNYAVNQRQARVLGVVQNQTSSVGVAGITLEFYDASGRLVGTVTSAYDGTFRASIPVQAVTFTVDAHTLNTSLYNVFALAGGATYIAGSPDCEAPLPSLSVGTQTLPQAIQVVPVVSGQPQPNTGGCNSGS